MIATARLPRRSLRAPFAALAVVAALCAWSQLRTPCHGGASDAQRARERTAYIEQIEGLRRERTCTYSRVRAIQLATRDQRIQATLDSVPLPDAPCVASPQACQRIDLGPAR
jgi:hypothetical protein